MINVWIALRDDAQILVTEALTTEDYSGIVKDREIKIFRAMHDRAVVQRLFKVPTINTYQYYAYSINFESGDAQKAETELDYLSAEYPSKFFILGAWKWNGDQISLYPIHPQAYKIMPDIVEQDSEGAEISRTPTTSNTDLRDVNLLQGQSPRDFS